MRVKGWFVLVGSLALLACTTQSPDWFIGNWKFVSGTEGKHPVMSSIQLMTKLSALGYVTFYDGKRTGFITEHGDTVKAMLYDVRNDTIITHSRGLDMPERFRFATKDTLWLFDPDSVAMKFVRVKR